MPLRIDEEQNRFHTHLHLLSPYRVITLDNLTYDTPNGERLFGPLNATIGPGLTGLVGANGVGKSTLVAIIEGRVTPSAGAVRTDSDIGFLTQRVGIDPNETIGATMGLAHTLDAIAAAADGRLDPERWDEIDWSAQAALERALARVGLAGLDAETPTMRLSGGQRVRLALAAALRGDPAMLVLDEPTNDLDIEGRALVNAVLAEQRDRGVGALVISHDRALLRTMDRIVELCPEGLRSFGGSWDLYVERRNAEDRAADDRLAAARRDVASAARRKQLARERKQRREQVGRRQSDKGVNSKVLLDAKKERSEQSGGSGTRLAERLAADAAGRLTDARSEIRERASLTTRLMPTGLHTNRPVIAFENVTAGHDRTAPVLVDISFAIKGPERVAVTGPNGSGKSTLISLASGALEPISGCVRRPVGGVLLDQHVALLDRDTSVLENFLRLNPDDDQTACRNVLAHFLFPTDAMCRPVGVLSGGETLRAALCCVLGGSAVPAFLMLDEPTNHLDIAAVEAIEQGLADYDGALLVVSHDEEFLEALDTDWRLNLTGTADCS